MRVDAISQLPLDRQRNPPGDNSLDGFQGGEHAAQKGDLRGCHKHRVGPSERELIHGYPDQQWHRDRPEYEQDLDGRQRRNPAPMGTKGPDQEPDGGFRRGVAHRSDVKERSHSASDSSTIPLTSSERSSG